MKKADRKFYTLVESNGVGEEINKNYNEFVWIKTDKQLNAWETKTLNFRSGTYQQYNLLKTIQNLVDTFELKSKGFNQKAYIEKLQKIFK